MKHSACLVTGAVAGSCMDCRAPLGDDVPAHVHEAGDQVLAILCAACCPVHAVREMEDWGDGPKTTTGEQTALF
jgi:hypothetical protein